MSSHAFVLSLSPSLLIPPPPFPLVLRIYFYGLSWRSIAAYLCTRWFFSSLVRLLIRSCTHSMVWCHIPQRKWICWLHACASKCCRDWEAVQLNIWQQRHTSSARYYSRPAHVFASKNMFTFKCIKACARRWCVLHERCGVRVHPPHRKYETSIGISVKSVDRTKMLPAYNGHNFSWFFLPAAVFVFIPIGVYYLLLTYIFIRFPFFSLHRLLLRC